MSAAVPSRAPVLVELCRRQPGKIVFGSAGTGSAQHLALEVFKARAGIDVLHVLPKNIIRELEEQAMEEVEEAIQSYEEDKADYLYEQWKKGRLKE